MIQQTTRSKIGPASRLAIAALVTAIAAAPSASAKDGFDTGFRVDAYSEYTDNLFHLSSEQFDDFGDDNDPGEAYFGMDDPEDVVTRVRLRADLSWRLAKKRDFRLRFKGARYFHARNSVSNYTRLGAEFRWDLTRDDRVFGGVDRQSDRFWKNYRVADTTTFAAARFDQSIATIGYERRIHKGWKAGVEYGKQDREYDAPLSSRDRDGELLAIYTDYDLTDRVDASTTFGFADVDTGVELDVGVPEDRSFTERSVEQAIRFKLSKKTRIQLSGQWRQRDASTDFTQDLARFDRVDRRIRLRVDLERKLSKRFSILLRASRLDNDSDRLDPTIPTDETGYQETSFGFGFAYER